MQLLADSDEFAAYLDSDDSVHILDGEYTIRVSMPLRVWENLIKDTLKRNKQVGNPAGYFISLGEAR